MTTNWSRHVTFCASRVAAPASEADLQSLVAHESRIHALGSGHSFNDLADTSGVQVTLSEMPAEVVIDSDRRIARVAAGMRFGEAAQLLDDQGWAVANLASLGHIGVAGTVATGTHGSGDANQTLSAQVRGLRTVRADGSVDEVTSPEDLHGEIVGLGALGIVTHVDLAIEPRFEVQQYVFDDVSPDAVLADFDTAFGSAYSVSLFTTWDPRRSGQLWMKRRVDLDGPWPGGGLLGGQLAATKRHVVPRHDPVHCTEQGGLVGPWHERLPHFRLDFQPSSGDELQTEYLVPRSEAVDAFRHLADLAPRLHELLLVSEIRTMAADSLWLSGAYGHDTVGFHFTWHRRPEVEALLPDLDALFGARGGRPHWGKLFVTDADELRSRYPRFADFARLAEQRDPQGKFRNRFLDWLL